MFCVTYTWTLLIITFYIMSTWCLHLNYMTHIWNLLGAFIKPSWNLREAFLGLLEDYLKRNGSMIKIESYLYCNWSIEEAGMLDSSDFK